MTRVSALSILTRAALVAAAVTGGLAGTAAATTDVAVAATVEIEFTLNDPGDWPWEILPIPPR